MAKILAAMSGGVDSSVAAALLVEEGHEVVGVSLQLAGGDAGAEASRCCSPSDLRDAALVAGALGIPHYVLNEEDAFRRKVLDPFLEGYAGGVTPNPCVGCNSFLKFGTLTRLARALGLERVATGHYARIERDPVTGRARLLRGRDRAKDQSYFLFDLDDAQREAALFPLGSMTKGEVYAAASRLALPVAGKPESQDLCFVPRGDLKGYLRARLGEGPPGEIRTTDGRLAGTHPGVRNYTIGQRRGIGIRSTKPLYVVDLDAASATVTVGKAGELLSPGLRAGRMRFHDPKLEKGVFRAEAKIRSRHVPAPCMVRPLDTARCEIRFDELQRAITPGQAVALYRGDLLLGGGIIERRLLDSIMQPPLDCVASEPARA